MPVAVSPLPNTMNGFIVLDIADAGPIAYFHESTTPMITM